jgi:hypothetical protein
LANERPSWGQRYYAQNKNEGKKKEMCVVSMVYEYGQRIPPDWWTGKNLDYYRQLIRDALRLDENTSQPDCEDANKEKFLKDIADRLERIEKKLNEPTI